MLTVVLYFRADIEDITSKTGNFKKFPVFVKMLLSAVTQVGWGVVTQVAQGSDTGVWRGGDTGVSAGR